MALVMTPIYTRVLTDNQTNSIVFNNIPQVYTDLKVVVSVRTADSSDNVGLRMRFNSDSGTNYNWTRIYGIPTSVISQRGSTVGAPYTSFALVGNVNAATSTANTFGSGDVYIPNYTGSNFKSVVSDFVTENNATSAFAGLTASLWLSTAAISTITITPDSGNNFVQHSSFSLYGIIRQGA